MTYQSWCNENNRHQSQLFSGRNYLILYYVTKLEIKEEDGMARKDISSEKKSKPLTKKERKERKRKRKEKHVYE
jgi:hypothetical protein